MKNGDTKESDKWMENCVSKVMSKMKPGMMNAKAHAIMICKASYEKSKGDTAKAEVDVTEFILTNLK
jgi:hypothetical protein